VPVIAPVDETLGLDPSRLGGIVSDKTKAIVAIHMRGFPCKIDEIVAFGKERGIPVLEDAAQALGTRAAGSIAGSNGDASIFSFQYHKLLTSGEGGMFFTNDDALYDRARTFSDNGLRRVAGAPDPEGVDCIADFGMNYRLSEVQAAILLAQFHKLDGLLASLRQNFEAAHEQFADVVEKFGLEPRQCPPGGVPNYAFVCYRAPNAEAAAGAKAAVKSRVAYVELGSDVNPHHYKTWVHVMDQKGYAYRLEDAEHGDANLERNLAFV
jgi:8-amino-3,8-dideoxy-alpha-D-manno-octulosonate transaminase